MTVSLLLLLLAAAMLPFCEGDGEGMKRMKAWFDHGSIHEIEKAAQSQTGERGAMLAGKAPLVAGALKTVDEIKKLALHRSAQSRHAGNPDSNNLFHSKFTGWGDKKTLEEGWKLTHGADVVHTSAAVRAAEAASRQAARGDKDSGDGFFDDWGHVSASPLAPHTPSSPSPPAQATVRPAAATTHTASRHSNMHRSATAADSSEGGRSDSSGLEPPPLPSFLKDKDPFSGLDASTGTHSHKSTHVHAHESQVRGRKGAGKEKHTESKQSPRSSGKPEDPIDKMLALQRVKRRKKQALLVSQAQRAASELLRRHAKRQEKLAARKAAATVALERKMQASATSTHARKRGRGQSASRAHAEGHEQQQQQSMTHEDVMGDLLRAAEGKASKQEARDVDDHVGNEQQDGKAGVREGKRRDGDKAGGNERRVDQGRSDDGDGVGAAQETEVDGGGGGGHATETTQHKEAVKTTAMERLQARKLVYDLKRLLHDAAESNEHTAHSKLGSSLAAVDSIDNVIKDMRHKLLATGGSAHMSAGEVLRALQHSSAQGHEEGKNKGTGDGEGEGGTRGRRRPGGTGGSGGGREDGGEEGGSGDGGEGGLGESRHVAAAPGPSLHHTHARAHTHTRKEEGAGGVWHGGGGTGVGRGGDGGGEGGKRSTRSRRKAWDHWLPIPGFRKEVSWLRRRTPKTGTPDT